MIKKSDDKLRSKLNIEYDEGYQDIEFLIKSVKPFQAEIPGWQIVKGPRKPDGKKYYRTNYRSHLHCQTFLDYLEQHNLRKKLVSCVQVEAPPRGKSKDRYKDLSRFQNAMAVISNVPFSEDMGPDWEITQPPRKLVDIGAWYTVYHSHSELWDQFINKVRSDKRLDDMVERMIPDKKRILTEEQKAKLKEEAVESNRNRRTKVTVTKGGGLRSTKYEYPPDCVTKKDRQRYRKAQRSKRGR